MKYKLARTKSSNGLYRITALIKFADVDIGDVGGYIESKDNLSQEGDAWVSCNAKVSGNAMVSGHAEVSGNAEVYGNAKVFGSARVYGSAELYDVNRVGGNAKIY